MVGIERVSEVKRRLRLAWVMPLFGAGVHMKSSMVDCIKSWLFYASPSSDVEAKSVSNLKESLPPFS